MIGQVFIFILAGLVFVLIATYGYRAVKYLIERQEQIMFVEFKTELESAVEGVKRDYGTVRKIELRLPSKYKGVCFFEYENCEEEPVLKLKSGNINMGWAYEACKTKSANVFTIPRTQDISLPDIKVKEGYLCLSEKIILKMEGTGKKAELSEWNEQ